jgi:hypothetical protein
MSLSFRSSLILLVCAVLLGAGTIGCGGKRDVKPDDLDIPTTLPREQILYRQARASFEQWIALFQDNNNPNAAYPNLSWKSRQALKAQNVTDPTSFGTWFDNLKQSGRVPFIYTFSRLDILEIDLKDTNRAVLTATFVVEVKGESFESVGIFFLRREHDSWRIPFAERSDYIRGWWQKEQNFDVSVKEAGLSAFAAGALGVEFKYPVAWDVSETASFKMPYVAEGLRGLELTYVNPANMQTETVIRVAELPTSMIDPQLLMDTSITSLKPLRQESSGVASEPLLEGKIYWLYNPDRERVLAIYAAVDTTVTSFTEYAQSIDELVRSIKILK